MKPSVNIVTCIHYSLPYSLLPLFIISGIYAYVILKDGVTDNEDDIKKDLVQLVKSQIGSFATPQFILVRGKSNLLKMRTFYISQLTIM